MADADRIAAALNYVGTKADPLESFRSLEGLKGAYDRRVQPIINSAKQTFMTGGLMGDVLRAYGNAAAPINAAVLSGMGMPSKQSIAPLKEQTISSGENFVPMGDPQQQAVGQFIGDPLNFVQPVASRLANAVKFAKPDALKALKEMSQGARSPLDVYHGAPQAEAMRLAQQRAALPVEQHGLGLPADNTPQQRVAAMGGEDVYHGTTAKKQILNDLKFNLEKDQRQVGGIWTTKDKNYATWLADKKNKDLANIMQLKLLNAKNSDEFDILKEAIKIADEINLPKPKNALEAQELLSGGYGWDRVVADLLNESKTPNLKITNFNDAYHSNPNEVTAAFVTKDPSLFRLPNAAFDPFRRNAALAAALGVAAPDLLAEENK
jgi:hypothetical protein